MSDFSSEVESFVAGNVDIDCRVSPVGCKFLFAPSKNLCFHLLELDKARDLQARDLLDISENFAAQGIQIIQLWEDLWRVRQRQIASRIEALCGNFKRIHARETEVIPLTSPQFDAFTRANHLQGPAKARFKYGLTNRGILVAAASFASFRNCERESGLSRSSELVRFANLDGHIVVGGLGKLIAHFERERKPDDIMTYADRDWSAGKSYRELGFVATGITEPQAFSVNRIDFTRRYFDGQSRNKNEITVYNTGNIKFLKLIRQA